MATRARVRKPAPKPIPAYEDAFEDAPPTQVTPPSQFVRHVETVPESKKVNKAQIIREFIDEVGFANANSRTLNAWLTKRYPEVLFSSTNLRTSLSLEKKKYERKHPKADFGPEQPSDITFEKLSRIKKLANDMCREYGFSGINAAKDHIEKIYNLAKEAGSFENLRKSLAALCELRA